MANINDLFCGFISFFKSNIYLCFYLAFINVLAIILYAADKIKAIGKSRRIRVSTLLGVAFLGGSVGSLISVYLFNHKTRKKAFTVGIPLIIVMQIALILFVVYIKM